MKNAFQKAAGLLRDSIAGVLFPYGFLIPTVRKKRALLMGGALSVSLHAALESGLPSGEAYFATLGVPKETVRAVGGNVKITVNDASTLVGKTYATYSHLVRKHPILETVSTTLPFLPSPGPESRASEPSANAYYITINPSAKAVFDQIAAQAGLKDVEYPATPCEIGIFLGPEQGTAQRMLSQLVIAPQDAIVRNPFTDREMRLFVVLHELRHCHPDNRALDAHGRETEADAVALQTVKALTGKDLSQAVILARASRLPLEEDSTHDISVALKQTLATGKMKAPEKRRLDQSLGRVRFFSALKELEPEDILTPDRKAFAHDVIYPYLCKDLQNYHTLGGPAAAERARLYLEAVEYYFRPEGKTRPCPSHGPAPRV